MQVFSTRVDTVRELEAVLILLFGSFRLLSSLVETKQQMHGTPGANRSPISAALGWILLTFFSFFFFIFNCAPQTTSFSLKRTPLSTGFSLKGGTIDTELCLFACLFVFRKRLIRFLFWEVENVQWRSFELKMVSVRSEKPINDVLHPSLRTSPKCCFWNSSSVRLIDDSFSRPFKEDGALPLSTPFTGVARQGHSRCSFFWEWITDRHEPNTRSEPPTSV